MSLFTYTGPEGHVWPDISAVPAPGDVWDWGDRTPDEAAWTPAPDDAEPVRRVHPTDIDFAGEDNETLDQLTKAKLVALAAAEGLELRESDKKPDLIAAIEEHRVAATQPPGDDEQTEDPNSADDANNPEA